MTDILVQIIFGWPAIIATLLVSTAGLVWKRTWLLLVGAFVIVPFSLYLGGQPVARGLGLLLPGFLIGAAFAVRARKLPLAWALVAPVFIVSAWLAYVVVTQ